MIITINISEEQVKRAEALARHIRKQTGEYASRSSAIGRAIDVLFLSECPTDTTDDVQIDQPAEAIN